MKALRVRVAAPLVEAPAPAWTNIAGAAAYTGLSRTTVRRAIQAGTLPASRVGARLAVAFRDVERWLVSARVGGVS